MKSRRTERAGARNIAPRRRDGTPLWARSVRWPDKSFPFDLRSLRYVLAAAESMSFSGAALALKTKVSTVSRRVRHFEDSIGVSLFERTSAGVRLTVAGARFLNEIVPAIQTIEMALHHADAAGRVELGTVRIGIITTLAGGFLRELIAAFDDQYPGVFLDVRTGGRRDHLSKIRSREIDVAFLTGNGPQLDCDVQELWNERVHVAMSADHPLAEHADVDWPDLENERFVVSAQEPGPEVHDYIVRRIADYSTYPQVTYRPMDLETLMHTIALGREITVVSEGWTSMRFPDLALRPLTASEDIVPFSAVWSPLNDNPALRWFISFARNLSANRHSSRQLHEENVSSANISA
ncbi:LysR family transcriptional regulator [Brucella anthropi]|uniref:LysR family transcriptional regulator n=1 Tax=Brucella anthropi TaxID=529 RepID=UPI00124EB400|nr:LysR family transcriptional regulator [Brucella anthropi]KAB2726429.1 LysR family transcriptional regulator [Brucella anthropi]KAB2743591.1 LysR family transcriptional regulator [Brucella anthropi]KAB2804338.1 LysR family transcriptional regulator [Brucella anthropi]